MTMSLCSRMQGNSAKAGYKSHFESKTSRKKTILRTAFIDSILVILIADPLISETDSRSPSGIEQPSLAVLQSVTGSHT